MDKFTELRHNVETGSIVLLTNGQQAEFVRVKQKNFIGIMNGNSYNIPISMFDKVMDKPNKAEKIEGYKSLKAGEVFYIKNSKSDAIMFIFKEIKREKIIGINPITKAITTIAPSLYCGKVADL